MHFSRKSKQRIGIFGCSDVEMIGDGFILLVLPREAGQFRSVSERRGK